MASHIEFKLPADGIAAIDHFGKSVAVDGDYIVVCAPGPDYFGDAPRPAAYFYKRSGLTWIQQARLSPSNSGWHDEFGASAAIRGNYAMVGASVRNKVYVFRRDGETWQEHATLTPPEGVPTAFHMFGQSVAISGDYAIVGADGVAYVFQREGTTWTQTATLASGFPEGSNEAELFGWDVAIDGDTVAISQPSMVHVFQREGATWTLQAQLSSSDPNKSDAFGGSIDLDGNSLIVGAFGQEIGNSHPNGKAYVFERTGNAWSMAAALEPESPQSNWFGWDVGISGDLVVVGDRDADGTGAVDVFKRQNDGWSAALKIVASDAAGGAWFGGSVAVDGRTVVVGAEFDSDPFFPGKGSAYVLTRFPDPGPDDVRINLDRWQIYAVILWGLTHGGGGFTIFPGGTGGPVDPEPFKAWRAMSPVVRDLYLSTLIGEVSRQLGNTGGKAEIQAAAWRLRKTLESELEREQKK